MQIYIFFCKVTNNLSKKILFRQLFQKLSATIFNEVESDVEITVGAVIRVRYRIAALVFLEIVTHANDTSSLVGISGLRGDSAVIVFIHDDDIVKPVEIRSVELLSAAVELVAPASGVAAHTTVGQFADMPRTDGCRRHLYARVKSLELNLVPHNGFGSRRAAYIAQTDEKNSHKCL